MFGRVWLLAAAAVLALSSLPPLALANAREVFADASPSVIVVLAYDGDGGQQAQGSGVVIGAGIAITNCHVIEQAAKVQIQQAADSHAAESYRMNAEVIVADDDKDLCLLYAADLTTPPAAKAATMGAAKRLSIGEEVYAIGAPQGLELSLSRGIVAQLRGIKGKAPIIQTDAAISPGSSGGGLFNEDGELVGITTFRHKEGEGLTFALPAEDVATLLKTSQQEIALATKWQTCTANPRYKCILDLAIQTARQIDDDRALSYIAVTQAAVGDINGAKQTAQEVSSDNRAYTLSNIAIVQAQWGDASSAKQIVEQIDNAGIRVASLLSIAKAQANAGEISGAKQTIDNAKRIAQNIDDGREHAIVLLHIAELQFKLKDKIGAKQILTDAINLAKQIEDADSTLRQIAVVQAKLGDIREAKQTAQQIGTSSGYRAESFKDIAVTQAEMGDIEGAKQTVRQMKYTDCNKRSLVDSRRGALLDIAGVQASSGDVSGARQTARQVGDCRSRSFILGHIAIAQADAGDVRGAIRTVSEINKDDVTLWRIAAAQAKSGDISSAKQTAEQVRIDYSGIFDVRSNAFSDIAKVQAESGDITGAKQTLRNIRAAGLYIEILKVIAVAQAEFGDVAGAMQTAKTIGISSAQAESLADIAKILAVW